MIMASGPITLWQIDGETMETETDFISWAPKLLSIVTAALKLRHLLLEGSYDKPRQHMKSRDITLLTNGHLVKAMVFPEVMYGCESWTIKKGECRGIDAFGLWC